MVLFVVVVVVLTALAVPLQLLVAAARSLVRADDELAEELVAQGVKVVAVELGGATLFEVLLCEKV